jgi:hypothetical protein
MDSDSKKAWLRHVLFNNYTAQIHIKVTLAQIRSASELYHWKSLS